MRTEHFTKYLKEIGNVPLLSPQEERDLGMIIRTNPASPQAETARCKLISANLRLVVSVANRNKNHFLSLEDAVAAGNVGLIKATDRFDPIKFQNRFSTYATWWILREVREAVSRAHPIRIPLKRARQYMRILDAPSYRDDESGQDVEAIARETGIPEHAVRYTLVRQCHLVSIDRPFGKAENCTLESCLSGDEEEMAFIKQEQILEAIDAMSECLNSYECDIIVRRFGIGCHFHTLDELAKVHSVSLERIRHVQNRALAKLRAHIEKGNSTEMRRLKSRRQI